MTTRRPPDFFAEQAANLLGEHLQAWRRLQGLTQEQVAERAGVSRGAVVRLEQGKPGVALDVLLRVAGAMHITDFLVDALDPYKTDLGRARADEALPKRVRR
jgi:transcriptional regulator with XRE-family HTH domain